MSDIEKEIGEVEKEFEQVNKVFKDLVDKRADLDRQIAAVRDDLTRLQGAARLLQKMKQQEAPAPANQTKTN
jgi:chromosome segregation ATPase